MTRAVCCCERAAYHIVVIQHLRAQLPAGPRPKTIRLMRCDAAAQGNMHDGTGRADCWRADAPCLYESVPTPEGVRYDVLHRRSV